MNLFLNIRDGTFYSNNTSFTPILPITFYENDIVPVSLQVLDFNPDISAVNPYIILHPSGSETMSIATGFPDPVTSQVIQSANLAWDAVNLVWTGSLVISGSTLQSLMLAESSSVLEVVRKDSVSFTTLNRTAITILPDIAKT